MSDNDAFISLINDGKTVLKGGLKNDMFDINKDGEINYLDTYVFELYVDDLSAGRTAEESILPADMWNLIDQNVELDNDNIPGTFGDYMIYQCVVGLAHEQPQYKLDIYYLQLLEKKGLVDLSDIRPYIEKLCKDKEVGDVDFDGSVNAIDASYVLSYYAETAVNAEISNVTVAHMEYMADINSDGAVNSVDASEILSTYASNSVNG
ncbi:dockerin type I domain-containing protein [Ruminococcus flavefaciens]|uniref:dockerin type I domain-containing protein n=1 Tax=Ruminococcus flavefaciens TaxID=1265 RepID=UPI0012D2FC7C|nr:dockerin type I domain-containing protein [Ruminococcus flavefaciens]